MMTAQNAHEVRREDSFASALEIGKEALLAADSLTGIGGSSDTVEQAPFDFTDASDFDIRVMQWHFSSVRESMRPRPIVSPNVRWQNNVRRQVSLLRISKMFVAEQ